MISRAKRIFSITFILMLIPILTVFGQYETQPEVDAVKQVVKEYVKSIDKKMPDNLEKLLMYDASIIGYDNILLKEKNFDREGFVDQLVEDKIGGYDRNLNIVSVDINDRTAMAEANITDTKVDQKEYISLIKNNGKWKIANITFSREKINM
jgi:hypothetical protein